MISFENHTISWASQKYIFFSTNENHSIKPRFSRTRAPIMNKEYQKNVYNLVTLKGIQNHTNQKRHHSFGIIAHLGLPPSSNRI